MSTQHHDSDVPRESALSTALWAGGALIFVAILAVYMSM